MSASAKPMPQLPVMAGVSRVSLEKQAKEGYSLGAQLAEFEEIGRERGCQFPRKFMVEDDGFEGDDFSRPSIQKVKAWGCAGLIEGVGWTHLDRFARDLEQGLRLIRELRESGLKVLLGNLGWVTDEDSIGIQIQLGLMFR